MSRCKLVEPNFCPTTARSVAVFPHGGLSSLEIAIFAVLSDILCDVLL